MALHKTEAERDKTVLKNANKTIGQMYKASLSPR